MILSNIKICWRYEITSKMKLVRIALYYSSKNELCDYNGYFWKIFEVSKYQKNIWKKHYFFQNVDIISKKYAFHNVAKNPCGFLKEIVETIFQKVDLKIKKKLKSPVNPTRNPYSYGFKVVTSLNFLDKIDSTRAKSFFKIPL